MNDMLSSVIRLRLYLLILIKLFDQILFFLPSSGEEASETPASGSIAQDVEEKI